MKLKTYLAILTLPWAMIHFAHADDAVRASKVPALQKTKSASSNIGQKPVTKSAHALNPNDTVGTIILVDEPAPQVLGLLEKLTGKKILRQQNLPSVRINFNSQGPMTREEAILALESLLTLNGVAVNDLGENFLKATPTMGVNSQSPKFLEGPVSDLPSSQRVYTKVFNLNHLTPNQVIPMVSSSLTPGMYSMVTLEKANAIMVTDTLSNLQRVESILNRTDAHTDVSEEILFIPLKNIQASELKARLQNMQQTSLKKYLENNTHFESDERSNQLVVTTHPSNIELIQRLVDNFDINVDPFSRSEVFPIKHADATEIAGLFDKIFDAQRKARDEKKPKQTENKPVTPEEPKKTNPFLSKTLQPKTETTPNLIDLSDQQMQFSEAVGVVADSRSNAIIGFGTVSDIKQIEKILEKLDVVLPQVRIDVIIAEVKLNDDQARGIDNFNLRFTDWGSVSYNFAGVSTALLGQVFTVSSQDGGPKTTDGTTRDFKLDTIIKNAKQKTNVSILSAPTILTTHNQEGQILVGQKQPIITSSATSEENTSQRSTVEQKNIGLELKVKPLISNNGVIQMQIFQRIENLSGSVSINGVDQPITDNREAKSFVSVRNHDIIVLGGLQSTQDTDKRTKLALLGDIPVLGNFLFSSKSKIKERRELMLFIQPHVIANSNEGYLDGIETINNHPMKEEILNYRFNQKLPETEAEKRIREKAEREAIKAERKAKPTKRAKRERNRSSRLRKA